MLLFDTDLAKLGRAVVEQADDDVRPVVSGDRDDEREALLAAADPLHVLVTDKLSLLSLSGRARRQRRAAAPGGPVLLARG